MKATGVILTGLLLITGLIVGLHLLHAQQIETGYSSNTFWLSVSNISGGQISFVLQNTLPGSNYTLLTKQHLTDTSWNTAGTATGADNQTWTAMSVPLSGQSSAFFEAVMTADQATADTNLWLIIPTNALTAPGFLILIISNTVQGRPYVVQTNSNLADSSLWDGEQQVSGGTGNTTTVQVPTNGSVMFVRVASGGDSTGSGIQDWWLLKYFGTTDVDPNALDSADDGWTVYQKYAMGVAPSVFTTPPTPHGVTIAYDPVAGMATVSWDPSPGPVTSYTVNFNGTDYIVPVGTTSLTESFTPVPYDIVLFGPTVYTSFQVQANYARGSSPQGSTSLEPDYAYASGVNVIPNLQGSSALAASPSALPAGTTAIRLTRVDVYAEDNYGDSSFDTNWDIPISSFTNGLCPLPAYMAATPMDSYGESNYRWWVQTVVNGGANNLASVAVLGNPFYDGRVQMKQNLIFVLRAASENQPFQFGELNTNYFYAGSGGWDGYYIYWFGNPAGYAWASPYHANGEDQIDGSQFFSWDPVEPFDDNYRYWNFVFNPANVDESGALTTGVLFDGDFSGQLELLNPACQISYPPTLSQITNAWLAADRTRWLYSEWLADPGDVLTQNFPTYSMAANARNIYGLQFLSAELAYWSGSSLTTTTLSNGNQVTLPSGVSSPEIYLETAQPQLQTVEYDFWNPAYSSYMTPSNLDLVPGMPGFSPGSKSRLMICPVGAGSRNALYNGGPFQIAGYAKLAILNGYTNMFAYLGQYFDQACQIDMNGVITTNMTGVLSRDGYFYPTVPGPAALVTIPDPDTGQRGTCTVYAISLNVDANHDGTMDLSFNGPDATSQASPMECWVNNGHDQPGVGGNLDTDVEVIGSVQPNYSTNEITCPRDLENFFRLWVCGVPSLPLSGNYTFTLSMSPVSGNPAINVYQSYETNGGIGYLTDTTVATQQANTVAPYAFGTSLGTVSNNCPCTIPSIAFAFGGTQCFLFEGAGIGKGQLTLTIYQNGNVIAQTSQWLDLHDIEDFYERAAIADNTSGAISNWSSTIESGQPAVANLCGDDTNLIVFVHGFDVKNWDWRDDSDTVLKRLYWAGFQGKFATVDWPCEFFDWSLLQTRTSVFNLSEVNAYKASTALATYLNQLRSRFPGYRLNLFVHSQGNAVVSEAIKQSSVSFDTYILTQGAMPDSSYDVGAPTDSTLLSWESLPWYQTPEWQPMGYHGIYTNFTGNIVNFYNPNDPVLAYWVTDQEAGKPNGYTEHLLELIPPLLPISPYYSYDGVNGWHNTALGFVSYLVTDPQESRAMLSRSRTYSIGQNGPASAHGVIQPDFPSDFLPGPSARRLTKEIFSASFRRNQWVRHSSSPRNHPSPATSPRRSAGSRKMAITTKAPITCFRRPSAICWNSCRPRASKRRAANGRSSVCRSSRRISIFSRLNATKTG